MLCGGVTEGLSTTLGRRKARNAPGVAWGRFGCSTATNSLGEDKNQGRDRGAEAIQGAICLGGFSFRDPLESPGVLAALHWSGLNQRQGNNQWLPLPPVPVGWVHTAGTALAFGTTLRRLMAGARRDAEGERRSCGRCTLWSGGVRGEGGGGKNEQLSRDIEIFARG